MASLEKKKRAIKVRTRNWTHDERRVFCEIIVNPDDNFVPKLKSLALRKASNQKIFEIILDQFNNVLNEPAFIEVNSRNFCLKDNSISDYETLEVSAATLRHQFKHIKSQWITIAGEIQNQRRLTKKLPFWFRTVHETFSKHYTIVKDEAFDDTYDLSFQNESFVKFGEDTHYDEFWIEEDDLLRKGECGIEESGTSESYIHESPEIREEHVDGLPIANGVYVREPSGLDDLSTISSENGILGGYGIQESLGNENNGALVQQESNDLAGDTTTEGNNDIDSNCSSNEKDEASCANNEDLDHRKKMDKPVQASLSPGTRSSCTHTTSNSFCPQTILLSQISKSLNRMVDAQTSWFARQRQIDKERERRFLDFLRMENEKRRQHELEIAKLIASAIGPRNSNSSPDSTKDEPSADIT